MKTFAVVLVVAVILLTLIAAFSVMEGATAAVIGASGFACFIGALCFYMLADIREIVRK